MNRRPEHLILYDPYCKLCAAAVKYVLKYDSKNRFYYGSLFSQQGKNYKKTLPWALQKNTIIYFEKEKVYTQSDAVIRIISQLNGIHQGFIVFKYLPKGFRDYLYKIIAKYRYNWFGKRIAPFVPDKKSKHRFVDYEEMQPGGKLELKKP
jgi:predicted DCC family thiol-disulfide oxidoreductase YuxK